MELYQALQDRRSVRKYQADDIPADTITRLLNAARVAPSWSNLQCWKFIVVRDPETRSRLAESLPDKNPAKRAMKEQAPVTVVLCADPKESGAQYSENFLNYYMLDAGLAMQQFMLAAHAEGLGTCWVGWFDEAKVRETCRIPADQRVVALTPLGVPAVQPSPRPRKELGEIAYADAWGKPYEM